MSSRRRDTLSASLLVLGSLAVLALSIVLYLTPPASGYEFSVYRGFPMAFWLLVVAALFAGQLVIVRAALSDDDSGRSWHLGLAVIMAVAALLFLLPYYRGYQAYDRADVLTHVGFVRNIHQFGGLVPSDLYPNIHLLTLTLSYATGVEPLHVINSIAVVIPLFSILACYALVTRVYDRTRALLTIPFASLLIAGSAYVNPSPFVQSTVMVPFVLYLFVRERQARTLASRVALGLVAVAIVIYHPLTTVFLAIGLTAYVVADGLQRRGVFDSPRNEPRSSVGNGMTLQLMTALFLSWYYTFDPILNRSREAIQSLVGSSTGQSTVDKYGSIVSETSPQLTDLVVIGFAKYGISVLLAGVAGLYLLTVVVDVVFDRVDVTTYELSFSFTFVAFTGLSVLFLLFDLVVGWGRPLLYVNVFGALLTGPLFYKLYQQIDTSRVITVILCSLLLAHAVFGVVTLYHSPVKAEPSHQVTDGELEGAQWLLQHRNRFVGTVEYGISFYRFGDAYYGKNKSNPRELVDPDDSGPPPHFGYDRNLTLGSSFERDRYMIITAKGRHFYPEMYPEYRDHWRFTPQDFDHLRRDPTVAHLYDNGEVDVYRVTETG